MSINPAIPANSDQDAREVWIAAICEKFGCTADEARTLLTPGPSGKSAIDMILEHGKRLRNRPTATKRKGGE